MEPTSENARQSRGLARFWPVTGTPAPAQRNSDEDAEVAGDKELRPEANPAVPASHSGSAQAAAAAPLAAEDRLPPTSDGQMVVPLGSRRGWNGNQGDFPPLDAERAPRHGGAPVPSNPPPRPPFATAEQPAPRPAFRPVTGPPERPTPRSPFEPVTSPTDEPASGSSDKPFSRGAGPDRFVPASPFAPRREFEPETPRSAGESQPDAEPEKATGGGDGVGGAIALGGTAPAGEAHDTGSAPLPGRRRSAQDGEPVSNGRATVTGWASVPTSGIPTVPAAESSEELRPAAESSEETEPAPEPSGETPPGLQPSEDTPPGLQRSGEAPLAAADRTDADGGPPGRRRARDEEHPAPNGRRLTSLEDADAALPRAGRRAADAPEAPLRPGDVNVIQIAFWDEAAINHFRSQWHEIKADFVDDPVAALTRAHDLLTNAVHELTEAMLAERDELDPLRQTSTPDTESMRMAMRGYREFLDRILAL